MRPPADGQLRKLDKESGKPGDELFDFNVTDDPSHNQKHYEALGESITDEVYRILVEEKGMHKIYVPDNVPPEQATFVFSTKPDLKDAKKLMILIHGSGVVRAGQWSRSLIINHSLAHGTQIPYVERAKSLGYTVLITNGNDNYRLMDGNQKAIQHSGSPTEHGDYVWKNLVAKNNPQAVAIVAHSYGGVVTLDLAQKNPEFFASKVFAVGLTDSVHSSAMVSNSVIKMLRGYSRNWVTSGEPLDTELKRSSEKDVARFSAGHTKHEWTSYSCMEALFEFFEKNYEEFQQKHGGGEPTKKPKLDL